MLIINLTCHWGWLWVLIVCNQLSGRARQRNKHVFHTLNDFLVFKRLLSLNVKSNLAQDYSFIFKITATERKKNRIVLFFSFHASGYVSGCWPCDISQFISDLLPKVAFFHSWKINISYVLPSSSSLLTCFTRNSRPSRRGSSGSK